MSSLELTEDEVQVWVALLKVSDARYSELEGTLSSEEHGRAKTLAPGSRRFVVARGMLRGLLSGFTGTAASKLRFKYGSSGKPFLAGHGIHFNVSHSAEVGLFAFAPDRPVGVDVENERPVRRLLDVAQRFLSEDEVRSLAATAPAGRAADTAIGPTPSLPSSATRLFSSHGWFAKLCSRRRGKESGPDLNPSAQQTD